MARTIERQTHRPPELQDSAPYPVVLWWGAAGAVSVGLWIYCFVRWISSDAFKAVPRGSDQVPGWMEFSARSQEVLSVTLTLACIYWFVIRPWQRDRRLNSWGILVFACLSTYWQDAMIDMWGTFFTYNAVLFNRGSWYEFLPFWVTPNGNNLGQPLLWEFGAYIPYYLGGMMLGVFIMKKAKARWPRLGLVGLYLTAAMSTFVIDLVIEIFWLRTGMYSYVAAIPSFTLFFGKYYQVPVYEMLLWGLFGWGPIACLFYFQDDKGRTVAERGIDRLNPTARYKPFLRFLAISGFLNVFVFIYSAATAATTLMPSFSWSRDAVSRSYLTTGICGEGTTYACVGKDLPIPRGSGGTHVTPDGSLLVPPGAEKERYK